MSTDWSLDFCIVCDRQTLGGAYCSQACRLAEMDQYSTSDSEPSSPTTTATNTARSDQSWVGFGKTTSSSSNNNNGQSQRPFTPLVLASSLKTPQGRTTLSSISHIFSGPRRPGLSPSSSHTSLSSMSSSSTAGAHLSGRVKSELQEYAGCFDQVRDWKRRLTLS
ncbi:hypothetical protein LOZ58_003493 [Ophidiomyces ophidiicola]|nr:hypothetical protein LOZ66_005075 [Ophidiomyces ophidiicola]KAI1961007.1 hypothetical protein LOZ58_003493 [Ophidiomyces ophidiicola]